MILEDIDLSVLTFVPRQKMYCKIYHDDKFYYKIWSSYHPSGYLIQDGLDVTFNGVKTIAGIFTGIINKDTCCALYDLIYTNSGICCGYVTYKGEPTTDHNEYLKLVDILVDYGFDTGYALSDVNMHNTIMVNGKCSLIDIDGKAIKLLHNKNLSEYETILWYDSFYNLDNIYTDKIKQRLDDVILGKSLWSLDL